MCYTRAVQTSFYASGFLYSLKTHRILLLQSKPNTDTPPLWSTLGGDSIEGESAETTFQRIVNKLLNLNLETKDIHSVYDYSLEARDKVNYVFYAEIKSSQDFDPFKEKTFSWVAFGETSKLPFSAHSKQDVIVGERVINAKWRDDEARKTLSIG